NVFFFSSRRRHTRSDRDWSSDVCSSDLSGKTGKLKALYVVGANPIGRLGIDPFAFAQAFVVVQDMFLTEAAIMADVVLPAANARSEERRVGKEGRAGWWREQ